MPTNYLSTSDFDAIVDGRTRAILFDDSASEDGSGYDSTLFDRACELASIRARAALERSGHEPGTSTTLDGVRIVALAALVALAYGRKGREVPEATQVILSGLLADVGAGEVPIPDLAPSSDQGAGGVETTSRSTTATGGRPSVFSDLDGAW